MTDEDTPHDVFTEKPEGPQKEEPKEPVKEEAEKPAPEEEEDKEAETEGDGDEPEPEEEEEEERSRSVPLAALTSERQKRQAAEEKLAKYEAQKAPDRSNDPEGYERYLRIEVSKDVMRDTHDDYDEMIAHFGKMVESNPVLNDIVGNHAKPAKYAYDLAKEDLKISKLQEMSDSDDWKQFQKWKKAQPAEDKIPDRNKAALKTPNLNKATSVKKASKPEDDDVFAGSHF